MKHEEIKKKLRNDEPAFEKFRKITKVKSITKEIDSGAWPDSWKKIEYKGYARFKEIRLPLPGKKLPISLKNILSMRRSSYDFSNNPLSKNTLSTLLYYSSGISDKETQEKRFYPSAGARYPLEIYVISLNTELDNGIYHYYLKNNSLEKLADLDKGTIRRISNQRWIEKAGVLIVISAVFERTTRKYGERGYQFALIEAGHLSQNIYLLSSSLGVNCCALGAFVEESVDNIIGIYERGESVVHMLALGNR